MATKLLEIKTEIYKTPSLRRHHCLRRKGVDSNPVRGAKVCLRRKPCDTQQLWLRMEGLLAIRKTQLHNYNINPLTSKINTCKLEFLNIKIESTMLIKEP